MSLLSCPGCYPREAGPARSNHQSVSCHCLRSNLCSWFDTLVGNNLLFLMVRQRRQFVALQFFYAPSRIASPPSGTSALRRSQTPRPRLEIWWESEGTRGLSVAWFI